MSREIHFTFIYYKLSSCLPNSSLWQFNLKDNFVYNKTEFLYKKKG